MVFLADAGKCEDMTCHLELASTIPSGFKYFLLYNMVRTTFLVYSGTDSNTNRRKDILTINHVSDEN